MDATNGFQEIKRASMHRAVLRRCPSLLSLFQKYYTKESLCFFNMEREVRLLHASEGARIGCKLSSFGFALTVQDFYETVSRHLARLKNGSCIKAATDDVIAVLKVSTEEELCASVRNICGLMNDGASDVGLSFANHKALLLLPKGLSLKRPDLLPTGLGLRSNTFEDSKLRGMEIVALLWALLTFAPLLWKVLLPRCYIKVSHFCNCIRKLRRNFCEIVYALPLAIYLKCVTLTLRKDHYIISMTQFGTCGCVFLVKPGVMSFPVVLQCMSELGERRFFHPVMMVLVSDLGNERQPLPGFVQLLPVSGLLIPILSLRDVSSRNRVKMRMVSPLKL
jgi:hypothetical protein